jgi:hypothetical protein
MYSELLLVSLNTQFISKYNVPELSALCSFTMKFVDIRAQVFCKSPAGYIHLLSCSFKTAATRRLNMRYVIALEYTECLKTYVINFSWVFPTPT